MSDEGRPVDLEALERGRMVDETWELHEHRHCNPRACVHAEAGRARKSETALVAEVKRLQAELLRKDGLLGERGREIERLSDELLAAGGGSL